MNNQTVALSEVTTASVVTLAGGCLCGAVRYTITPPVLEGYYCHCRMCQLAFGNTRAAFINVPKTEVQWQTTPKYYQSSKFARRGFCDCCGTPLSFEYLDSERMDLSIGSLDEPQRIKPVLHFAIESRLANWHGEDGLPGKRLDEYQAIMQRWREAYGADAKPELSTIRQQQTTADS